MRTWLGLAIRSARSRQVPLLLVTLSFAVSVTLLLGVLQLRAEAQRSFGAAVSGIDLIVGPRGGETELVLYSVFHLGRAARNMPYKGLATIEALAAVRAVVPIQLGDTYRGHAVVGTTNAYFALVGAGGSTIRFRSGRAFVGDDEIVLGAALAHRFGHAVGDAIHLTHGHDGPMAIAHDEHPFRVVGVLEATGTPVDRAAFVSLGGFERLHEGWALGVPPSGPAGTAQDGLATGVSRVPAGVTAAYVTLHRRGAVFGAKRAVEAIPGAGLMAILPGVALDELWQTIGVGERALLLVAAMVLVASLLGLTALMLVSLAGRRRELALLRALGVRPAAIGALVIGEALLVGVCGVTLGWLFLQVVVAASGEAVRASAGIVLAHRWPDGTGLAAVAMMLAAGVAASAYPAWLAYRQSVHDGLNPAQAG